MISLNAIKTCKGLFIASAFSLGLSQPVSAQDACRGYENPRSVAVSVAGSNTLLNYAAADSSERLPNTYLVRIENNRSSPVRIRFPQDAFVTISFTLQPTENFGLQTGVLETQDFFGKIEVERGQVDVRRKFGTLDRERLINDVRFFAATKDPVRLDAIKMSVDDPFTLTAKNASAEPSDERFGAQSAVDLVVKIPAVTSLSGKTQMVVNLHNVIFECGSQRTTHKALPYGITFDKQPLVFVDENVGIGTSEPRAKLHVNGTGIVEDTLAVGRNFAQAPLDVEGKAIVRGQLAVGTNQAFATLDVNGDAIVREKLMIGSERQRIIDQDQLGHFSISAPMPTLDFVSTERQVGGWRIHSIPSNGALAFVKLTERNGTLKDDDGAPLFISTSQVRVQTQLEAFSVNTTGFVDVGKSKLRIGGETLEALIEREVKRIITKECFIFTTTIPILGIDALIDVDNKCVN